MSDSGEKLVEILVITNPIHTDIAIPATQRNAASLWFSWGKRPADGRAGSALAGFRLGRAGVLHGNAELGGSETCAGAQGADTGQFGRCMWNSLARSTAACPMSDQSRCLGGQFSSRCYSQIAASFDPQEPAAIEGAGYGANDRFYEANGYFNVLLGCNTWAARMLRAAGCGPAFGTRCRNRSAFR